MLDFSVIRERMAWRVYQDDVWYDQIYADYLTDELGFNRTTTRIMCAIGRAERYINWLKGPNPNGYGFSR